MFERDTGDNGRKCGKNKRSEWKNGARAHGMNDRMLKYVSDIYWRNILKKKGGLKECLGSSCLSWARV